MESFGIDAIYPLQRDGAFWFIRGWQDYFEDGGVGQEGEGRVSLDAVDWGGKEISSSMSVPRGGLLPAEERILLVYIGSHVAGQLMMVVKGDVFISKPAEIL